VLVKPTATTITDAQCEAVVALMPFQQDLLDSALGTTEPQRNQARHELAKLWIALACTSCTLQYLGGNHPTGCIFVGWGHGWQPCSSCGGSGLSPMGNTLRANGGGK
jgi:hypothetical protein